LFSILAARVSLLALFYVWGYTLFVILNASALIIYLIFYFLLTKEKYELVNVLITLDVIVYTLLVIYLIGGLSSFAVMYIILLLNLQPLIPYKNTFIQRSLILAIVTAFIIVLITHFLRTPVYAVSLEHLRVYAIFNIYLTVVYLLMEIIFQNILRSFLLNYQLQKLEELDFQAHTDFLTGLFNRRYADSIFSSIRMKEQNNYVVALLDIDNFKKINDTFGHTCGDEVLKFLSVFLSHNVRKSDVLFRWGGEEFLVLLKEVDLDTAYVLLERMRKKLANAYIPTKQGLLRITVTIGMAILNSSLPFQSIDDSDKKLYEGKQRGKNMVMK
jgi:diguanylate cyclase (GGDEF)-like protein